MFSCFRRVFFFPKRFSIEDNIWKWKSENTVLGNGNITTVNWRGMGDAGHDENKRKK
jgi:hypothetical protein